jgi:UDP-glucose 4-epimerase
MQSRRILITGLSSYVGGRVAQALERDPAVETLIGVDLEDPRHELERTEFVRVDIEPRLLRRILRAAAIDTVIDIRLVADPMLAPLTRAREVNVVGTQSLLAACSGAVPTLRKLVVKSSAHYYGHGSDAPAFITEELPRRRQPRSEIERDVVAAEQSIQRFATRHPEVTVTVLRLADEIGTEQRGAHLALLGLPVVPTILGFDPRFQFIHEDDVVGVLAHSARHDLPGAYNAAGDGVLALSEVVSMLGKTMLPVLPPWGISFAAAQLRRLGLRIPLETIHQLRYGRGLDNRRLKAAGYNYRYTSREAVLRLRAQQRLRPLLRSGGEEYRYEPDLEEFLRWSPSVQAAATRAAPTRTAARSGSYDELSATELLEVIPSLEPDALEALRSYEQAHQARAKVLKALDRALDRPRS